ncbi:MAG TPA: BON domain-containing protein [Pirellulaceae bacterium]|nr:BON domain-containing protein [Pirellulaceae bacterium]
MAELLFMDMVEQARARLMSSRIYVLRQLHVLPDCDAIVLRGNVDSYYHKQLAQELVRMAVDGVEVINDISVVYRGDVQDDSFPRHEWT